MKRALGVFVLLLPVAAVTVFLYGIGGLSLVAAIWAWVLACLACLALGVWLLVR